MGKATECTCQNFIDHNLGIIIPIRVCEGCRTAMKNTTNTIMSAEKEILELTAELWNVLRALPELHPDDLAEHRRDIHNIQNRVASREYFKKD